MALCDIFDFQTPAFLQKLDHGVPRNIIFYFLIYSGDEGKRHLWNDGNDIIWYHFIKIVQHDMNNALKLLPKLTLAHVNLTPYSKMNVRLATQILSESVSCILREYFPIGTFATSQLCHNVNRFFDCLNTRSKSECITKRNEFCATFRFTSCV